MDPTFATFTRAPGNEPALEACLRWSRGELEAVLVLEGPSGSGKTHLARAAADAHLAARGLEAVRVSAAVFCERYVEALRADRLPQFRREWLAASALIVEHLEDLGRKETSREVLWQLVGAARARGTKVMLSVTHHPPTSQMVLGWLAGLDGALVVPIAPGAAAAS